MMLIHAPTVPPPANFGFGVVGTEKVLQLQWAMMGNNQQITLDVTANSSSYNKTLDRKCCSSKFYVHARLQRAS